MKGTTNAQQNAVVDSSNTGDELTLTYANGTSKKHDLKTSITVDSSLSSTSTNPVQNKVVQTALNDKQGKLNDTQMNAVNSGITATLVQKYNDMVSSGGEPNVIETVKVNNAELPVSGKAVNIDLSGYATKSEVGNKLDTTTASNTYATKDDLSKKADSGSVYTKTEVDSKVSSVYRYKSSCKYADLPTSGNTIGDVYNVTDAHGNVPAGTNYAWNGTAWDALAGTVDLSPYAKSSEVYSKTTADSTFYKTTDTVANATKATQDGSGNVITSTYATKTEVSGKQATLTTTQMNAVNSGITAAKVSTYDGYQATINGKQDKLTFDTEPKSGSTNPVTSGGVYNAINNKQDKLTIDETPTSGSTNPVTSGGVYNAINTKASTLQTSIDAKQNKLDFDEVPTEGSSNPVTSGGVYTAINDAGSNSTLTTLSSVGISEYLAVGVDTIKLIQPIRVQIVSAVLDSESSWRDDTRVIDIVLNPFEVRRMSSYSTVCIYGQQVLSCTGISKSASTNNDILSFEQYYVSIVFSKTPSKSAVYVMKHSTYSSSEYKSSSQFSFRSSIPTNNASRNYYLVYI